MSAFNLSTLVAMRDERLEQASAHFWRCQLTAASPRHSWDPSGRTSKANADGEGASGDANDDDNDDDNNDVTIKHLLQVTGCVLTPGASGVHLITVRTSCYQKQQPEQKQLEEDEAKPAGKQPEPAACPIVCIDPSAQRTLALGHEFVPATGPGGSAGAVVFELAEGTGPVWLTGTHRVQRVTRLAAPWFGDHEEEEEEEEDDCADGDNVEEEDEEVDDEDGEEEAAEVDDDEDEEEEEAEEAKRRPAAQVSKKSKGKGQAGQQQQQQQRRKRAKPDS